MSKILVIGDAHAKPDVSNERFTWLGKYIMDERPDKIVCIGDLFDMESLSLYDVGKRSFQGRTYKRDIAAGIDAQDKLFAPLNEYNSQKRRYKERLYRPELHITLGNHENRVNRALDMDHKLEGTIGEEDFQLEEYGWNVHKYKKIVDIDGIYSGHLFTSGLMDRPIGGTNIARTVLNKLHENCIFGHTHLLDYATTALPSGRKITSINVGCYFDHKESYVTERAQAEWSRGILTIQVENKEIYDFNWTSLKTLKKEYGK